MEAAGAPRESSPAEEKERRTGRSGTHSGRLLLRMPESLHAALARASEAERISLNAFINDALASAIGWQGDSRASGRRGARPAPAEAAGERRRGFERLLVANLVVVAVVGILAVALLVQALR